MTNGHEVRATVESNADVVGSENTANRLTEEFKTAEFFNFVEGDKLVIVNMRNVSHIKVYKIEED